MSERDPNEPRNEPRPEEEREAEALARALDRGSASEGLPEDALETASLLRYGRGEGELGPERRNAILEQVFDEARAPQRAGRAGLGWIKWLLPVGGLAAAGAAAFLIVRASQPGAAPPAVAMPEPDAELLRAQAEAAGGSDEATGALRSRMRDYRGEVVLALGERYGR